MDIKFAKKFNQEALRLLRENGYQVKVTVFRTVDFRLRLTAPMGDLRGAALEDHIIEKHYRQSMSEFLLPKGGTVQVSITFPGFNGAPDAVAVTSARCSDKDVFCKAIGLKVALERMLNHLNKPAVSAAMVVSNIKEYTK